MRKLMMFDNVSADGFYAGTDGGLDWVTQDPEQHAAAAAALPDTDTVLFGRKTYAQFASFWPHALDGGAPHGGSDAPAMRAIAKFLNDATKLVFSTTLTEAPWRGTRILPAIDARELAALKAGPGKSMILFGSGSIVAQLSELGLIDEYQIVVNPILLGRGQGWAPGLASRVKLQLVESRAYGSGNVMLRYKRA